MSFTVKVLLSAILCAWLRMPGGWPSNWRSSLGQFIYSWIIGAIWGDARTGLIVGGMIQTINLVPLYVGGVVTMDLWFACCVTIPMVIESGMTIETAVSLAAPLSILGNTVLNNLKQVLICDMWAAPMSKKLAQAGNDKQLRLLNILYVPAANVIYGTIFSYICISLGTTAADSIVNAIPEVLLLSFNAVAGVLPAIGMMMFIAMMGNLNILPYYFLGFYLVEFFGLDYTKIAIIAIIVGFLVFLNRKQNDQKYAGGSKDDFGGEF